MRQEAKVHCSAAAAGNTVLERTTHPAADGADPVDNVVPDVGYNTGHDLPTDLLSVLYTSVDDVVYVPETQEIRKETCASYRTCCVISHIITLVNSNSSRRYYRSILNIPAMSQHIGLPFVTEFGSNVTIVKSGIAKIRK